MAARKRTKTIIDDDELGPSDDKFGFFQKGRDFESVDTNHQYTSEEQKKLAQFESLDYLPSTSAVYARWKKEQPTPSALKWFTMFLVGLCVGLTSFALHQAIEWSFKGRYTLVNPFIENRSFSEGPGMGIAWGVSVGYSLVFVLFSTLIVVFIAPAAAGSGIPEVIGFLNGVHIPKTLNFKTLVIKFFSCATAVGSGMPVGPEGPMIHMGAMIGAGVSQMRSKTLGCALPIMKRFRNLRDKRDFITAGVAAGVAAAFGAPVGGLLFCFEEVASFWNQKLSWQIFFACMMSVFTADFFNSLIASVSENRTFIGTFSSDVAIIFEEKANVSMNVLALIPAIVCGVIGGVFGSMFTILNLKIAKFRRNKIVPKKALRILEPIIIMMITSVFAIIVPAAMPCTPICDATDPGCKYNPGRSGEYKVEENVEFYDCAYRNLSMTESEQEEIEGTMYSELATLLYTTGDEGIRHLFSRATHYQFGVVNLLIAFFVYFILACWAAGSAVASGLVVPMLFTGALYGRIVGVATYQIAVAATNGTIDDQIFGTNGESAAFSWIDPGVFALVGAASFFGGVSRLTMSLTVIMLEISGELHFLLPIMTSIMVAKWIADKATHSLYHSLLELKCIPFLDHTIGSHTPLDSHTVEEIMTKPLVVVHETCTVGELKKVLEGHKHGGFPVIEEGEGEGGKQVFKGVILRTHILQILRNVDKPGILPEGDAAPHNYLEYEELTSLDFYSNETEEGILSGVEMPSVPDTATVDLRAYVNRSALAVQQHFSLERAYVLFRGLGLRYLTVVDSHNQPVGILTRKDLIGHFVEHRVEHFKGNLLQPLQEMEEMEGGGHKEGEGDANEVHSPLYRQSKAAAGGELDEERSDAV